MQGESLPFGSVKCEADKDQLSSHFIPRTNMGKKLDSKQTKEMLVGLREDL